jgi:glycosyltransferase involved in cell wall biosynthesis
VRLAFAARMSALTEYLARARLALRYRGVGGILRHVATAPVRALRREREAPEGSEEIWALEWYHDQGGAVPATVVVTGGGGRAARVARRTTRGLDVDVVRAPDASTAAVNEAIAAAPHDVVLLGPEVRVYEHWLQRLQWYARRSEEGAQEVREHRAAIGVRELDPDGSVRACGLFHDPRSAGRLADRFQGRDPADRPCETDVPVLADPGECLYIRRDAIERVGPLDESLPMPWAVIDWSLRAWRHDLRVVNYPAVSATQLAPPRDPAAPGAQAFWARWRDALENRDVRTDDGKLRIAYVTEDTGVGGGHRVIFEHCNRLADRGHDVTVYSLAGPPDWFDLRVPVRTFERYEPLLEELTRLHAIKVATWWNTALPVWLASVARGIPASFVQDIETSYYPGEWYHGRVLASYREEFSFITTSGWNRDRLREMGLDPTDVVSPGIDLEVFRALDDVRRHDDLMLAIGRGHWIKNLDLTVEAWQALGDPPPAELRLYGSEPDTRDKFSSLPYVMKPSDAEVNRLLNEATVFVQTSIHEGFCLPPLEAMAAGCAVVCTDAHGNLDYCEDGVNCLMPEATAEGVAAALRRVLEDRELRERLVRNGHETVAGYGWEARIDVLERFFESLAASPTDSPRSAAPLG